MNYLKKYFQKDINLFLIILLLIFSKEIIVINSEFIIGLSFLILFFLLQRFSSSVVISELDYIKNNLFEQYYLLYKMKLKIKKNLLYLYEKKSNFYKFLKRITYRIEDILYYISLRRTLIIKENYSKFAKVRLINFLIKYNYKLNIIYNNILHNINIKVIK